MDKIAHGFLGSDADGFHGFFIFDNSDYFFGKGDHTDARLRLRPTDLYGFHGSPDYPLRVLIYYHQVFATVGTHGSCVRSY